MPNIVTCDCKPLARIFSYGDSLPVDDVDLRTSIGYQEYLGDRTISSFDLPYCKTINEEAFMNSSVTTIDVPVCTKIGKNAFKDSGVRGGDFSSVLEVGDSAFANCWTLGPGELDFRNCKVIGNNAFRSENRSTGEGYPDLRIRDVETIGESAFYGTGLFGARTLRELNLPYCKTIGAYAFGTFYNSWRNDFLSITLPSIEVLGNGCFRGVGITEHEIRFGPNLREIGEESFRDASILTASFYIEAVSPPDLKGGFSWGYDDKPAHIYVPANSVLQYQQAEGWENYSTLISALPDDYEPIYPPH